MRSIIKQLIVSLISLLFFASVSLAASLDPNTKLFAKQISLGTIILSANSGLISYDGIAFTPFGFSISKKGIVSGSWRKTDFRGADMLESSVTLSGKIKKIQKKGKDYVATVNFTSSDGGICSLKITYSKLMGGVKSYTSKGSFKLTTPEDGTLVNNSVFGAQTIL